MPPKSEYHSADRRSVLKSAGLILGTSAFTAGFPGLSSASRRARTDPQASTNLQGGSSPQSHTNPQGGQQQLVLNKKTMGFMLGHEQFPVPRLLDLGVQAERAGFDLLATSDHFQPWQANEAHSGQAWVTMAALGQKTSRVWIGPAVTCPTFRYNPAVVAEAFSSLSLLNPGRIFLGIGSGEALNEQSATGVWPNWEERSERLIEATQLIRELWTGQPVKHKGKYYTVDAKLYDPPAVEIPILMAANGPKAMIRAAKYADGLVTDPKTWKDHKSNFQNAAKAAGKNPADMPVLVEQFVVVGDQNDAKTSAELWRFLPKAFKTYYNVLDPSTIQRRAEAEIPLETVYGEWPISTEPEVHIKAVQDLFDSGASIVNIHSGQEDQSRVIDFYGKNVLPKLKGRSTKL